MQMWNTDHDFWHTYCTTTGNWGIGVFEERCLHGKEEILRDKQNQAIYNKYKGKESTIPKNCMFEGDTILEEFKTNQNVSVKDSCVKDLDVFCDHVLRVSKIPKEWDEKDLKAMFQRFGQLSRVFLAKHQSNNESRGFAFVGFDKYEDATQALAYFQSNDAKLVKVAWAKLKCKAIDRVPNN